MWSVGHHKILSTEIQKIVMASNLRDNFGSHISNTGGQNKISLGHGFALTKATLYIPKNEKKLS